MAKILLVEDDNNLREIFEMRLRAEGYQTLSANDGEQALEVALREKPDLIIADVMMPRLSGFEMVETLRASPEMGNTKVVMMTALGQAEDRARGDKLGVVKYLVKSQVTLEDFVRVVREVLQPDQAGAGSTASADKPALASQSTTNKQESEEVMQDDTSSTTPSTPDSTPPADDTTSNTNPISGTPSSDSAGTSGQMTSSQQQDTMQDQINNFVGGAPSTPTPSDDSSSAPTSMSGSGGQTTGTSGGDSMPTAGSDSGSSDIPVAPAPESGEEEGSSTPSAPGAPSGTTQ